MEETATATAPVTPAPETPKTSAVDALFAIHGKGRAKAAAQAKTTPNAEPQQEAPSPVETAPEKKAEQDSAAKQMALIARESKRLAAEKDAIAKEREQAKADREELERYRAAKARIKTDPLRALKDDFDLEYDGLIRAELARQEEEANPAMREVKALKQAIAEKDRISAEQAVEFAKQRKEALVNQHVSDIRTHIAANAEKYEFLSTYKAERDVFDRIQKVFDETVKYDEQGRIAQFKELTIDEACLQLESEYEESAGALTKLKKMQAKIQKQIEAIAPKTAAKPTKEVEEKPKSASLTNSLNGGSEKARPLTREERKERAFAALHGQH